MQLLRLTRHMGLLAVAVLAAACHDLTGTQPLPAGAVDPKTIANASGARAEGVAARLQFQQAFAKYLFDDGLLSDELQSNNRGQQSGLQSGGLNVIPPDVAVDARLLLSGQRGGTLDTDAAYDVLQATRGLTNLAIGALHKYDADNSATNRGELYALEGYAEVMLADLFCSGVPLSTIDFEGDFTYAPSSNTSQVYTHALALFDTALTLAGTDPQVSGLAKIGRARALLGQGQYAAAATAVSGIPVTFQYAEQLQVCSNYAFCSSGSAGATSQAFVFITPSGSESDREGGSGLPFRSSNDPRTTATLVGQFGSNDIWAADKYPLDTPDSIIVASGVEAQLILAEASVAAHTADWLTILNALRTDGTESDGTYNAGTGGVANLAPLDDPGTDSARVSLVFRERAFWLFLTGHRVGDLRRLVRQYGRNRDAVFPSGSYPDVTQYGPYIDAPIPATESPNPLFHGCLSRD